MELTGVPAAAVLAAPLVLLVLILIAQAARGRRRPPRRAQPTEVATGRYGVRVPERRPPEPSAAPAPSPPATAERPRETLAGDIPAAIAAAEGAGDEPRLAGLYIALAGRHSAAGRGGEAADCLRKSIRIAARLGLRREHAAARLELGDLARASGDLTTACEHWQIARGLFTDLRLARDLEAAEGRMRDSGCPTDWVLNDF